MPQLGVRRRWWVRTIAVAFALAGCDSPATGRVYDNDLPPNLAVGSTETRIEFVIQKWDDLERTSTSPMRWCAASKEREARARRGSRIRCETR